MTRFLSIAWCALLPVSAAAQPRPATAAPAPPPVPCPARPAECQASTPVYNFGRHEMSVSAAPILAENTVTVTCTKANGQGFAVDITYDLMGLPSIPDRVMRDRELGTLRYDLFVDAGRTQYWGDGQAGTKTLTGKMEVNDTTRVVTVTHQLYGTVLGQQTVDPGQWLGFVSARLEYTIKKCR
jgi:spore coat protein U-like protein